MEKLNECFCINKYTTALIEECLEEAVKLDPDVEVLQKDREIIVKKKGEVSRLRISEKDGVVYISFKGQRKQRIDSLGKMQILKRIAEISKLPNSELMRKKRDGKTFSTGLTRYEFVKMLAEGIDPTNKTKVFIPSKDLSLALKSLNTFILRYENMDAADFRVFKDEEQIKAIEEKIRLQKEAKHNDGMRSGVVWKEEEDKRLIAEYSSGKSIDEIMTLHNRTRSAIERRLLRLLPIEQLRK